MDKTLLEEIKENKELVANIDGLTIVYYDANVCPAKDLYDHIKRLGEALGTKIVAIPKQFDVLLNCSVDQLTQLKHIVDTAIAIKLEQEDDLRLMMNRASKYTS